ncbi:hypothetical protein LTR37_010008 [Vermiconidia calcicola]|uniref:Uncharacterized protein n=1 Tax=Vermiconidia calcicola TaxID=1690605 RepID=A0ACC3N9B2_9PEZI|nr:hypothetical protein LTR37_010008 [Vermiconidia calcicola]
MPTFHIRPGSVAAGDPERLLDNFDSQLPWLATKGSGGQWGSTRRGDKADKQEEYRAKVKRSETYVDQPLSQDWIRTYIAEVEARAEDLDPEIRKLSSTEVDGRGQVRVPVAGMVLDAKSADYVRSILPERDEEDPFVYLHYLLSDRRTSSIGKGAGAALIAHAKEELRKLGVERMCCDCWRGNDRRLVSYYETQGFKAIGDFGPEETDSWLGTVLEMRL